MNLNKCEKCRREIFGDPDATLCDVCTTIQQVATLQKDNDTLKSREKTLWPANLKLKKDNDSLKAEVEKLNRKNTDIWAILNGLGLKMYSEDETIQMVWERAEKAEAEVDCGSDDILCPTHKKTGKACNKHLTMSGKFLADELLKAEAERDMYKKGGENLTDRLCSSEAERDRLRLVFHRIEPHVKHREDTSDLEVCYSWCPACAINEAINHKEK